MCRIFDRFTAIVVSSVARCLVSLVALGLGQPVHAKPGTLIVPTAYPTIQAAINAAASGDRVSVLPGTYVEQLSIAKNLTITGSGMDSTIIRAPATLLLNQLGETSIVEIAGGASVAMSKLTVAGPGSGTCASGTLKTGIRVHGESHLDFSFGAVRDIHDTPLAACFHSGNGFLGGKVPNPTASLTIDHSIVANYQSAGIVVLGFGSTATITHNTVTGPGVAGGVGTNGIEFPVGSVGTVTHNVVSGNICPTGDSVCGSDWFSQFQYGGIVAGGWGPGTVVSHNVTFGNQVGLFLGEADEIHDNTMIDNDLFGMILFDGTFLIEGAKISAGGAGIWLVAVDADTHATLDNVKFKGLFGPAVDKLECCGFTATITERHE